MEEIFKNDPEIFKAILEETKRQNQNLELIASENFASLAVLEAQGSVLTNKYAEGYPDARWYGGCKYVDMAEDLAKKRAVELFRAEHANVQPHSGTQANMAVYFSCLKLKDTVLAMDLACGGHLTHGHPHNFSGRFYNVIPYGVREDNQLLDYSQIQKLAKKHKPKLILAGACAYSRIIDFEKFKEIADSIGALLFVDMAHIAGIVAAGLHPSPIPYAEFVSSTTHKTLRGPRGGMILCKRKFAKRLDSEIFPGIQGGPLMHIIAAKAVAFKEAQGAEFREYQAQIIKNAKALAQELKKRNYKIVSGDTDNHLMLVDLQNKKISGNMAAIALDKANITVNKNLIPFDPKPANITSGVRLGTPAVTTRGMKESDMKKIAGFIDEVLKNIDNEKIIEKIKEQVSEVVNQFPVYTEIIERMESLER